MGNVPARTTGPNARVPYSSRGNDRMPKRFILTGTPGAGKTSLLRGLAEQHRTVILVPPTRVYSN